VYCFADNDCHPAILVEGTRIKAAQTQIESALDISAKSALANYNYLLKELYGLMALSSDDPDLLMEEIIYYLERNLMVEGIKEHKTKAESTLDTINESETVKNIKKFWEWTRKKRKNLWICMIIKLKMLKFSQYITVGAGGFKSADTGIYEIQRSEGIV